MSGLKERIVSRRGARSETVTHVNGGAQSDSPPPTSPAAQEPAPVVAPPAASAPAPTSPPPEIPSGPGSPEPGFVARSRLRRRARYLRQLREIQLRDIGGFVLELHRFGRERPDLVREKVAWAAQTDAELRGLERALAEDHPMREIREAGIGGACENCGAVHGSRDRFCATCGEPLSGDEQDDDDPGGAASA